jgi:putative sigma-54 modulation protein
MTIPLQIQYRGIDATESIEARIREKADKLSRHNDRIMGCRVTVSAPHRHNHKGQLYDVRIELQVPGETFHVDLTGTGNHAYEDVYVALRDAFGAAQRKLETWAEKHQA